MHQVDMEGQGKWQPVMVFLRGGTGRLECRCGALAIIIIGLLDKHDNITGVDYWCQTCYLDEQKKEHQRLSQGED